MKKISLLLTLLQEKTNQNKSKNAVKMEDWA
jgi:hypothetical protein